MRAQIAEWLRRRLFGELYDLIEKQQDTIDSLLDNAEWLDKLNTKLDTENAEFAAENDRLQQKADEHANCAA